MSLCRKEAVASPKTCISTERRTEVGVGVLVVMERVVLVVEGRRKVGGRASERLKAAAQMHGPTCQAELLGSDSLHMERGCEGRSVGKASLYLTIR